MKRKSRNLKKEWKDKKTVYIKSYEFPVGKLTIGDYKGQLCLISYSENIDYFIGKYSLDAQIKETKLIKETKKQLLEYFEYKREIFNIPLYVFGTDFQKRVYKELLKIPFGKTVSYGYIASSIGGVKYSRAVGNANNKNNIPIVIPCHRIVGSNGKLVGYAGGLKIKGFLLKHEMKGKKK